ncbi:hypothetical protein WJX82_000059 [Trebouxia sp. C0006]
MKKKKEALTVPVGHRLPSRHDLGSLEILRTDADQQRSTAVVSFVRSATAPDLIAVSQAVFAPNVLFKAVFYCGRLRKAGVACVRRTPAKIP